MPDYETPRPQLHFSEQIDYYDTTDFGLIAGEVANDSWVGVGDAMATLRLVRGDGSEEDVHLPVQVENGPVTRGARFTLAVENVTRTIHGETKLRLVELSGADASGASEWTAFYGPIRSPFE
jgi:hypothetical protein